MWNNDDNKTLRSGFDRITEALDRQTKAINRLADILERDNKETTDE